jgi:predicted nuclease of restriction endonuclease-like (RecB) superfamily
MPINNDYRNWLADLKKRIRQSQIKASVRVNTEMLQLYWSIGCDIVSRQAEAVWGSGIINQLSKDLQAAFPEMQGFSRTNLKYCKRFYLFYTQDNRIFHQLGGQLENSIGHQLGDQLGNPIIPQLVGQIQTSENELNTFQQQVGTEIKIPDLLGAIPWRHHIEILTKCKNTHEAVFYIQKTIENGWSRAVLMNFLEADLYSAQGKSLNNFSRLLPAEHSDLASEILKDPYNFDFLTLATDYKERELENALSENITRFLLELGKGFAFVGRQVPIKAGSKELFIDMLFYHLKLRCYVVVELKAAEFEAAFAGQLGVYVAAVNHQLKGEHDTPTLGLIICKTKDNVLAQYALESSSQPIGVSEYELAKLLTEDFKSTLPSIEEIENELNKQ